MGFTEKKPSHCLAFILGAMYPVVHPVYQNTLAGSVIGFLDYYMQGYLNGGFFKMDAKKNGTKRVATRF